MATEGNRQGRSLFGSGRELMVFFFFLVLSGGFWFFTALNETYEKEIAVRVQLSGVPNNIIITNDVNDTLRVVIRDKGFSFLNYTYGRGAPTLVFDFHSHAKGNGTGTITASEIQKQLAVQLSSSTKVVSVKPERLDFSYDKGYSKRVPVRLTGTITPAQDYFLAHKQIVPQMVTVYALKSVLDTLTCVYTEPIIAKDFVDSVAISAQLRNIRGVKMSPSKVNVTLYADVMTEQTVEVPIVCTNVPDSLVVRTFPAKAEVKFNVGASLSRSVSADQFCVELNYAEFVGEKDKCAVHLTKSPGNATNAQLMTREVDYLVESK